MYFEIISDLAIYSNAFIERHSDGATILRHDSATSTIMTEMVRGNMISEEIAHRTIKHGRENTVRKADTFSSECFLDAAIWRIALRILVYRLAVIKINSSGKGKRKSPAEITQINQRIVNRVIIGAGMHPGLFDGASSLRPGTISLLKMDVQHIQ